MVATDTTAPRLELDWEEGLFKLVRGLLRRWRPAAVGLPAHAAALAPLERRLSVIASVLAGRPMRVLPSDGALGLRKDDILLPAQQACLPSLAENVELYRLAVVVLAVWRRAEPRVRTDPRARARDDLRGAAAAVAEAAQELPGFAARWARFGRAVLETRPAVESLPARARAVERHRQSILRGEALPDELDLPSAPLAPPCALLGGLFEHPDAATDDAGDCSTPATGRERAAPKSVEDVRRVVLDETPERNNPVVHTFEKVETLDSHEGGTRLADGSDELDEQLEALEEVDLSQVVRGGPPAQAVLRADVGLEAEIPDVERVDTSEPSLRYDEWDVRRRRYRKGWATVYPTPVRVEDPAYARAALAAERRRVEALFERLVVHQGKLRDERRQLDGESIDLDAAIDAATEQAAGRDGSGRVYVRKARRDREVATAVLMDVSLSSDAWVLDRRVLDVTKRAVLVLGEVADRLGDELAVYAFASKTRNACRVYEVGGFGTAWARTRARIGALEPRGYTRMGPAIRHVTAQLAAHPAKRRLLLVLSDGKPTDYDRYEGRYGMADIRKSLFEASAKGVVAHALTIDSRAGGHLSATFGPGAWHVLTDPRELPDALTYAYGRLSAG